QVGDVGVLQARGRPAGSNEAKASYYRLTHPTYRKAEASAFLRRSQAKRPRVSTRAKQKTLGSGSLISSDREREGAGFPVRGRFDDLRSFGFGRRKNPDDLDGHGPSRKPATTTRTWRRHDQNSHRHRASRRCGGTPRACGAIAHRKTTPRKTMRMWRIKRLSHTAIRNELSATAMKRPGTMSSSIATNPRSSAPALRCFFLSQPVGGER